MLIKVQSQHEGYFSLEEISLSFVLISILIISPGTLQIFSSISRLLSESMFFSLSSQPPAETLSFSLGYMLWSELSSGTPTHLNHTSHQVYT